MRDRNKRIKGDILTWLANGGAVEASHSPDFPLAGGNHTDTSRTRNLHHLCMRDSMLENGRH